MTDELQNQLHSESLSSLSYNAFIESPEPSFKHTTYFSVYDALLERYRGSPITFLEIGVLNGGSLFMWRKFFGDSARIIGIDLNPEAKKWEEHGFEIFIGSQEDPTFWAEFCESVEEIDVVLDDGGHTYLQQIITTETLLGRIKDQGMLIVEDTHTSYMSGFGDPKIGFMNYILQTIHRINSRFGAFQPAQADRRVWSVEVFESIAAFKVNKSASQMESEPVWNREPAPSELAKDFRYERAAATESEKRAVANLVTRAFQIHSE
jgi:hypothetical protein